jgi:hypothetical protein
MTEYTSDFEQSLAFMLYRGEVEPLPASEFRPGDRISHCGIPGIITTDADTPAGCVAVVYNDSVCTGVWFVDPLMLDLVSRGEDA